MTSKIKRISFFAVAAFVGAAAFLTLAPAGLAIGGEALQTLCFRNRTIQVPNYLVQRYITAGATNGPCTSLN